MLRIVEKAIETKDSKLSRMSELRRAVKETEAQYGEDSAEVLEYLTTMVYYDWGLARHVLRQTGYDVVDKEVRLHMEQFPNEEDAEECAFWDVIEMYLQEMVS